MKRVQKEAIGQYQSEKQSNGEDVKQAVAKDNKQKASKEPEKPQQAKKSSKSRSVSH